jgi:DNA-directed RNA polymerase specialized sigma24 family protein
LLQEIAAAFPCRIVIGMASALETPCNDLMVVYVKSDYYHTWTTHDSEFCKTRTRKSPPFRLYIQMTDQEKIRIFRTISGEYSRLSQFLRPRLNRLEDAEDLLQDILLQALENLNVLNGLDNLVELDAPDKDGWSLRDVLAETTIDQDDEEQRDKQITALLQAIEELPEAQRFVLLQNEVEGVAFRELAQETGESINTLMARKRYALNSLRKKLRPWDGE